MAIKIKDGEVFWVEKVESTPRWLCYWDDVVIYRVRRGSPKSPEEVEYFEVEPAGAEREREDPAGSARKGEFGGKFGRRGGVEAPQERSLGLYFRVGTNFVDNVDKVN